MVEYLKRRLWIALTLLIGIAGVCIVATGSRVPIPPETSVHAPGLPAQRIIPANAGSADIVSALVSASRIVAMPEQVGFYAGAREFYQQHQEIPRFAKYNAESVLPFKPDLILTTSFQDPATSALLRDAKIRVLTFDSFTAFDGIRKSILDIGAAVGEDEKAKALTAEFDARLEKVAKRIAGLPHPRALFYSNFGNGYAVGAGESQDEILRRAGMTNAATEMHLVGHVPFNFEQMLQLNPDWLVVSGEDGMESRQVKILLEEPTLANLAAIKGRRIAVVPVRFTTATSQYVVDAVEILAGQVFKGRMEGTGWRLETGGWRDGACRVVAATAGM